MKDRVQFTDVVTSCARCGKDHNVSFSTFVLNPVVDEDGTIWDCWGFCPTTGDVILGKMESGLPSDSATDITTIPAEDEGEDDGVSLGANDSMLLQEYMNLIDACEMLHGNDCSLEANLEEHRDTIDWYLALHGASDKKIERLWSGEDQLTSS